MPRYIPDHKVKTNYGPFGRYYIQQDLDEGHLITTSIPVEDVSTSTQISLQSTPNNCFQQFLFCICILG